MPTATIITSTGPKWGNSAFNSSTASLKVGKSGTSSYYGYVGFPRLNPAWYIKSIKFRMKREDTYSTKVLQFGTNQSSAWDDKGSLQWSKDYSVPSGTGTKEWDLTAYKTILQGYAGTWYLQVRHGSGDNSYCEFAGGTTSSSPRLVVEYEEASLTVPGGQFTIGAATAITVGTAGSGLTHKLSYSIGTASGLIADNITAGASVNWTPPTTLTAQITDAMAGMVTLTLESYLAGVLSSTLTFTYALNIPASYVPTISAPAFALSNPSGDTIGIYVQGRSRTVCTISAAAPGGATIQEYRLTLAGKTYSSTSNVITSNVITSNVITSDVLTATGALNATVVVVDSRGQSATLTKTSAVTIQPYTAPMITSFSVARCLSDGALSNSGTYIKYTLACLFSALSNLNTRAGSIKYKVTGGSFSVPVSLTSAMTALGTVFSFTLTGVLGGGAIGSGSYVVSASLTDRYATTTDEAELASRTIWFDLHGSGEGVAIGKVADTASLFDVGLSSRFRAAATFNSTTSFGGTASFAVAPTIASGVIATLLGQIMPCAIMRNPTAEDVVYNATTRFWLLDWQTLEFNGQFTALKGGTSNLRDVGLVIPATGFYRMTFGILLSKASADSGGGAYILHMPSSWSPPDTRNYMLEAEWLTPVLRRAMTYTVSYSVSNTSFVVTADMLCNAGEKVLPTVYMASASKTISTAITHFSAHRVG